MTQPVNRETPTPVKEDNPITTQLISENFSVSEELKEDSPMMSQQSFDNSSQNSPSNVIPIIGLLLLKYNCLAGVLWLRTLPVSEKLKKGHSQIEKVPPVNVWLETLQMLLTALVLAFGIRTFIAEARYIPSSSMEPTLLINDRLIVEKVSYKLQEPQRGDIVVFYAPVAAGMCTGQKTAPKDAFIKRIIGLPGETIAVKNKLVYINNKPMAENYLESPPKYNYGPVSIPDNHYFLLGDNRNNSCDSHYWGFVPRENFVGRAFVRFWPFNRLGMLTEQSGEQPGQSSKVQPAN